MRALVIAFGFVLLRSTTAAALDVTTCGQIVPEGEVGRLVGDLDCPGAVFAVALEADATFDLQGFALSGTHNDGVQCRARRCSITGPGLIKGGWTAVSVFPSTALAMHDVTIRDAEVGILAGSERTAKRATVVNVTIEGSLSFAFGGKAIRAEGLRVTGGVQPDGLVVFGDRIVGSDIEITNNGGLGMFARKIKVRGLTATNNSEEGVRATLRAVLFDSTITGNQAGGAGIDVVSEQRPKIVNTVCGRSSDHDGGNWGVCTND